MPPQRLDARQVVGRRTGPAGERTAQGGGGPGAVAGGGRGPAGLHRLVDGVQVGHQPRAGQADPGARLGEVAGGGTEHVREPGQVHLHLGGVHACARRRLAVPGLRARLDRPAEPGRRRASRQERWFLGRSPGPRAARAEAGRAASGRPRRPRAGPGRAGAGARAGRRQSAPREPRVQSRCSGPSLTVRAAHGLRGATDVPVGPPT